MNTTNVSSRMLAEMWCKLNRVEREETPTSIMKDIENTVGLDYCLEVWNELQDKKKLRNGK